MGLEKTIFKGKYCKIVLDSDFCLYGVVLDVDEQGLYFKTDTHETSFITWNSVKSIVERKGH